MKNGLKIPKDISIVGYDDISLSSLTRIPLTTIHQPAYTIGTLSVNQLIKLMNSSNDDECKKIIIKPDLVIRDSCRRLKSNIIDK